MLSKRQETHDFFTHKVVAIDLTLEFILEGLKHLQNALLGAGWGRWRPGRRDLGTAWSGVVVGEGVSRVTWSSILKPTRGGRLKLNLVLSILSLEQTSSGDSTI